MKASHIIGLITALALIVFGCVFPVPDKHLRVSSYSYYTDWNDSNGEEYVGGDAYNYQMEASLKAGYMSGVMALKAVSTSTGVLLFFITLYSHRKNALLEEQNKQLSEISKKLDFSAMPATNPAPAFPDEANSAESETQVP